MVETAPRKKNECLQVGARVIAKACHVTNLSECSRRYGSNSKNKLLIGVVFKTSGDVLTSGHLRMNVHARFELGGGILKSCKINLRSCRLAPGPILCPDFIHPPAVSVPEILAPIEPIQEVQDNFTVATRNEENLPEVDAVEVAPILEAPIRVPRNPNIRNDVDCHGMKWMENDSLAKKDQNGPINSRTWGIQTITGDVISQGCELGKRMSRLNFFLLIFPPAQLTQCTVLTNKVLKKEKLKETTTGEILIFFGIIVLMSKFEFNKRRDLWTNTSQFRYVSAPALGKTGMARKRFDLLWRWMVWSDQPEIRPETMKHSQYRWKLVDGFVKRFNDYRAQSFIPSEMICVDESISRWYGQGGDWINFGLPHYVAIDRKPENGCEIQDSCCGVSGIMMRLKVVKQEEDYSDTESDEDSTTLLHGVKVLKE